MIDINDKLYDITFAGLKLGEHKYVYPIDVEFFSGYDDIEELKEVNIQANILLKKGSSILDFRLKILGTIEVFCDVSREPFQITIDKQEKFIVKFGKEYKDDDGNIIIIPHGEYKFNIKKQIFETIILSIPMKKIHPDVINGTMKSDILDKLEYSKEEKENEINPIWNKLKELI